MPWWWSIPQTLPHRFLPFAEGPMLCRVCGYDEQAPIHHPVIQ